MKPRVYVETTIPSYLTAWPSRDLIRTANQQLTREWWARRAAFDLFVSRLVLVECQSGDPTAAVERLAALVGVTVLEESEEVADLAAALALTLTLPPRAEPDAVHIAVAAVYGMQYLLTWNCTHIANAALRPRIEAACRAAGREPPLICTPAQLPPEEDEP